MKSSKSPYKLPEQYFLYPNNRYIFPYKIVYSNIFFSYHQLRSHSGETSWKHLSRP